MDIYDTFVIEERYGFNRTTPLTFAMDYIKMLAISLVIMVGMILLFLFMYTNIGNYVFLIFFFVLLAFQVFLYFISPLLIRIIYKFTPLENGELMEKIKILASSAGYKLKGIYMVDASKRSTKPNTETHATRTAAICSRFNRCVFYNRSTGSIAGFRIC